MWQYTLDTLAIGISCWSICWGTACVFYLIHCKPDSVVWRLNVPLNTLYVISGTIFFRPDDQTNSVKTLKETSWSSRLGLNPTRTTPPCYNNTTLGNRLYTQHKGPNVTNPICLTCKNWSYKWLSVLLTVNILSHNPAQSSSDNILSYPPDPL